MAAFLEKQKILLVLFCVFSVLGLDNAAALINDSLRSQDGDWVGLGRVKAGQSMTGSRTKRMVTKRKSGAFVLPSVQQNRIGRQRHNASQSISVPSGRRPQACVFSSAHVCVRLQYNLCD